MNGSMNGAKRLLDRFTKKPELRRVAEMTQVQMPKVAICVPSGDMVHTEFALSLAQLQTMNGAVQGMPHIPTALINTRGSLVVRNRCEAIDHAVKLGVDYVLFLDSDMVFPGWTLRRLLSHEKDIVGASYLQRDPPHRMLGLWAPDAVLTSDRPHEVIALPGGCLLIKLSVFEGMAKPYFRTPAFEADGEQAAHIQGEDYYFCEQAAKLGHQIWLDVGLTAELGHVGKQIVRVQAQGQPPEPQPAEPPRPPQEEVSDGQAANV